MTKKLLNNDCVLPRQIAFAAAFLLPTGKLLEAPSLLAERAAGDLLLPALLHFLLQAGLLWAILYASSTSEKTLFERLEMRLGGGMVVFYVFYALYFLFAAILPIFDLEKFIYAAFFDTAPTVFSFTAFFFLSAYVCAKGIKALGRAADLSAFLFVIPFFALLLMSLSEADFTHLLPLFGSKFGDSMSAFTYTTPHFSDVVLLLPLLGNLRYKKGDGAKIMTGYGVGALSTLLFLAVFFGVYSSIAPREHYAFSKIAEYFPALSIVGRVDLLFVYLLTIVLLFFTSMPLQYGVDFTCRAIKTEKRAILSALLNFVLLLFVFFGNKYYNTIRGIICGKLPIIFWLVADLLPLFLLFLPKEKEKPHA